MSLLLVCYLLADTLQYVSSGHPTIHSPDLQSTLLSAWALGKSPSQELSTPVVPKIFPVDLMRFRQVQRLCLAQTCLASFPRRVLVMAWLKIWMASQWPFQEFKIQRLPQSERGSAMVYSLHWWRSWWRTQRLDLKHDQYLANPMWVPHNSTQIQTTIFTKQLLNWATFQNEAY